MKSYFEPSSSAMVDKMHSCKPMSFDSIFRSFSQNNPLHVETNSIGAVPHTESASHCLPSNGIILQDQGPDVP